MRLKGFNFMWGVTVLILAIVGTAAAQTPPSSHYTGTITSTTCKGTGWELGLEIQNNILAGQSTMATFYVNGMLIDTGTFTEDGPYTSLFPDYGIGPGVAFDYPNGTIFQSVIDSYDGLDGTGTARYRSSLSWVCDTGEVVSLENGSPPVTWTGDTSFPVKITSTFQDGSGNIKFEKTTNNFSGKMEMYLWQGGPAANHDGCYVKFLGGDGTAICMKQVASVSTEVQKSKSDQMLLIGRGELVIPIAGVLTQGIVYMDAKGTLKKDNLGKLISVSISGKIAGGFDFVFNGNFKSTLTE